MHRRKGSRRKVQILTEFARDWIQILCRSLHATCSILLDLACKGLCHHLRAFEGVIMHYLHVRSVRSRTCGHMTGWIRSLITPSALVHKVRLLIARVSWKTLLWSGLWLLDHQTGPLKVLVTLTGVARRVLITAAVKQLPVQTVLRSCWSCTEHFKFSFREVLLNLNDISFDVQFIFKFEFKIANF